MSPSKLVLRPVFGVGQTGERNPMSLVLSRLLDDGGPKSLNSVSLRFRGNMIGVFKTLSESTWLSTVGVDEASDPTAAAAAAAAEAGGFFEEPTILLLDDGEGYSWK